MGSSLQRSDPPPKTHQNSSSHSSTNPAHNQRAAFFGSQPICTQPHRTNRDRPTRTPCELFAQFARLALRLQRTPLVLPSQRTLTCKRNNKVITLAPQLPARRTQFAEFLGRINN